MTKKELKILVNVRDSINELLGNIYDAGEDEHPETGEPFSDVLNASYTLTELNKLIEANNA